MTNGMPKLRWRCSTHCDRGCFAAVYTINNVLVSVKSEHNHPPAAPRNVQITFSKNRKGGLLLELNGYTYRRHTNRLTNGMPKLRWRCSTHCHRGCIAAVYTINNALVSVKSEHNHLPAVRRKILEFIQSKRGKRLLLYEGYSYYATSGGPTIRWRCSTNSYCGCRATVHTYDDVILYTRGHHGHPPRIT
ncbi:FLYWCH-type zinc finger-containing protein 1 [Papilio machaon]|uniref:FLYWCH-type zinc finger-containing protein 1 n=1 Tax=Papilio machaon TaxID=76193 RepID=A0A0N1I724_PAPMA|nr:FLYWCH-type zinc finger-containing protein 1 [Papilio machaon]